MKMKKKIGFWRWIYTIIKNTILFLWNEGPTHRAMLYFLLFTIGFIIFSIIWNPSNDWIRGNQWYLGIMFIPVLYVIIRGVYSAYEEFTE